MYHVTTIITPINYVASHLKAVDAVKEAGHTSVSELQLYILMSLKWANSGMCRKHLMHAVRKRYNCERFQTALDQLIMHRYLTKKKQQRYSIYSTTFKGRCLVDLFEDHLLRICEENAKKYNSQA